MKVEVYRDEAKPVPQVNDGVVKTRLAELQNLQQRYRAQGLTRQVEMLQVKIDGCSAVDPGCLYPRLSEEDLKVWRLWLPTSYWHKSSIRGVLTFSDYAFDRMPEKVLKELELTQGLHLFENYEIRTPERLKAQDPILIGWRNGRAYLLARWAESLRPFGEIQKIIAKSFVAEKNCEQLPCLILCGGLWGGVAGAYGSLFLYGQFFEESILFAIPGALVGMILAFVVEETCPNYSRQGKFIEWHQLTSK